MVFGISGTKRTVRNREVSVRRGYTVSVFFSVTRKTICRSVIETDRCSYKLKKIPLRTWDQTCSKHKTNPERQLLIQTIIARVFEPLR